MNDTNNANTNTQTKDNTMQLDTIITTIKEAFTSAVKAEVEKHQGIDKDKLHEAVAVALSEQDSDTHPCMDDVIQAVEGNFDEWFTNCLSSVDLDDHLNLSDRISDYVGEIDWDDKISDYIYQNDIVSEDRVQQMIENADSDFDLSEANNMLKQVARGGDCSDGNDFREAVQSIVRAMNLKDGHTVDDGTPMSVKATGDERQIQAILTRRRAYFEELHSALTGWMGLAPNGEATVPPIHDAERMQAWMLDVRRNRPAAGAPMTEADERSALRRVAVAATDLLGLLSGLYHGNSGADALNIARAWRNEAERCNRDRTESFNSDAPEA
tara:strand:+ start:550 stop:1527 length:978 start_codon:yes stop_codon:yes gene_type:complete